MSTLFYGLQSLIVTVLFNDNNKQGMQMFSTERMILNLKAVMGLRSITALALELELPASMIRNMENTNNPTIKTLSIIADKSGIDLDSLVGMGIVADEK